MEERIAEVAETAKMITPSQQETVKAIRDGARVTAAAVEVSIEARASASFQIGESFNIKTTHGFSLAC